jgi:hypothetical protein
LNIALPSVTKIQNQAALRSSKPESPASATDHSKKEAKQKTGRNLCNHKHDRYSTRSQPSNTSLIALAKKTLARYNNLVLGVGNTRYAVGGTTPSVWGGLLVAVRPARHFILFCFLFFTLYSSLGRKSTIYI